MSVRPNIKDYSRILIVEGYSDLLFYAEVLERIDKTGVFIKEMNGRESLGEKLDAFLTPVLLAEKESIGIIVDADDNPSGAFQGLAAKALRDHEAARSFTGGLDRWCTARGSLHRAGCRCSG
jgi:hypothetical protein